MFSHLAAEKHHQLLPCRRVRQDFIRVLTHVGAKNVVKNLGVHLRRLR